MAHTLSLAQVVDSDNSEVGFAVVMVTRVMSSSGHVPIVRGVQHQLKCLQSWSFSVLRLGDCIIPVG